MAVPGNCNLMSFLLAIMPCCVACVSLKRRKQLPQLPTVTVAGFEVPPPECSVHLSDTDKKKSIQQIIQEHSNLSPSCLFAGGTNMAEQCEVSIRKRDYTHFTSFVGGLINKAVAKDAELHPDEKLSISYTGADGVHNFTTRLRKRPSGDIFCHAMGFIDVDKSEILNFEAWTAKSKKVCERVLAKFPATGNTSMTEVIAQGVKDELGILPNITTVDYMEQQAAIGCLLGIMPCSLASCVQNFCMLPAGQIGHGTECGSMLKLPAWLSPWIGA
jgi:hypothetical protein